MRFLQFDLALCLLWRGDLAASRGANLVNSLFFRFLRGLISCLVAVSRWRVLVKWGRKDKARDVFRVVIGGHESHFGDFVFCYNWLTWKLSKAKALVVRANCMVHWKYGFLMWAARIHCVSHLIHLINDLFCLYIAHWFSINCIFKLHSWFWCATYGWGGCSRNGRFVVKITVDVISDII